MPNQSADPVHVGEESAGLLRRGRAGLARVREVRIQSPPAGSLQTFGPLTSEIAELNFRIHPFSGEAGREIETSPEPVPASARALRRRRRGRNGAARHGLAADGRVLPRSPTRAGYRVKLNCIVSETSMRDAVMPGGKGGSCAPRNISSRLASRSAYPVLL
jgi:hypothetical protein